jgi:hypothetical protein
MTDLHDPSARLLLRMALLDVGLGASSNDVRDVSVALDSAKVFGPMVARVSAQMLVPLMRGSFAFDDDGSEYLIKPLAVMDVGPGHDERQRGATTASTAVSTTHLSNAPERPGPESTCQAAVDRHGFWEWAVRIAVYKKPNKHPAPCPFASALYRRRSPSA